MSDPAYTITASQLAAINTGDRLLVSEYPNGRVWHTATHMDGLNVYTREVPEGFNRSFVLAVESRQLEVAK